MRNPFRNIFTRGVKNPDPVKNPQPTVANVWESPALFNRETRRRARLWGRIWRWDLNATEETRREYLPRYIRRHFDSGKFLFPKTRRQRRHRARIIAISNRSGVGR